MILNLFHNFFFFSDRPSSFFLYRVWNLTFTLNFRLHHFLLLIWLFLNHIIFKFWWCYTIMCKDFDRDTTVYTFRLLFAAILYWLLYNIWLFYQRLRSLFLHSCFICERLIVLFIFVIFNGGRSFTESVVIIDLKVRWNFRLV